MGLCCPACKCTDSGVSRYLLCVFVCLCACVRYERHQARLKAELAKIAEREELTRAMTRERLSTRQEADRVKQLVRKTQQPQPQCDGSLDANYTPCVCSLLPFKRAAIQLPSKTDALIFHVGGGGAKNSVLS